MRGSPRNVLAAACGAHVLHDGLIDAILIFLPLLQAKFALSFAFVGLLRSIATGTMAAGQIPAGALADRIGSRTMLAAGTFVAGTGYLFLGLGVAMPQAFGGALAGVLASLALVGLGASVQHPVSSELIASAWQGASRRMALGVYNFTGDIGKTLVPPLAALLLVVLDWQKACLVLFALAAAVALALMFALPDHSPHVEQAQAADGDGNADTKPFRLLVAIGIFDSATRMAFLTFLPFLLSSLGGTIETNGLALALLFAGGAAGKFVCAWLGARLGPTQSVVLTEVLTALAIAAAVVVPLGALLALLPLLGVALNGTSSILYGSVAELVPDNARRRAFAIFYTATVGSGAVAPIIAGLFIDRAGLGTMMLATAALAICVVPLAIALRPAFQAPLSGASTSPLR